MFGYRSLAKKMFGLLVLMVLLFGRGTAQYVSAFTMEMVAEASDHLLLQLPGQGVGLLPDGTDESNPVMFEWMADQAAEKYWLWVEDQDGRVWDGWITATEARCSSGAGHCKTTLPVNLLSDDYLWWILPANLQEYGSWSRPMSFSVDQFDSPAPPTILDPVGEIVMQNLSWPIAQWTPVEGTQTYVTWLSGPGIDIPIKGIWQPSGVGCVDEVSTCNMQLDSASYPIQYNTTYHLTVEARSDYPDHVDDAYDFGVSASETFYFSQGLQNFPGEGQITAPSGIVVSNPVMFEWSRDRYATRYLLWIDNREGNIRQIWLTAADAGCGSASSQCSYGLPEDLSFGEYTWWILPANGLGNGSWSQPAVFTVSSMDGDMLQVPGQGILISPNTTSLSNRVTFEWQAAEDATEYMLWIDHSFGNEWKSWIDAEYAGCPVNTSNTCTYTMPLDLIAGAHTWWILPANQIGQGIWSDPMAFNITSGSANQLPTQSGVVYPQNTVIVNPVYFEWISDIYATKYRLWLEDGTGVVWDGWVNADDANCSAGWHVNCVYHLPMTLGEGQYTWWVQPANNLGVGGWSSPANFSIDGTYQPDPPAIHHPAGEIVMDTLAWPLAQWTHVEGTQVYITFLSGPGIDIPVKGYVYPSMTGDDVDGLIDFQIESASYPIQYNVEYHFTVTARSDYAEFGDPTDAYDFSVTSSTSFTFTRMQSVSIPGQGVLLEPNQMQESNPVTFHWQADPVAAKYWLWIENDNGREWDGWVTAGEAGCGNGVGDCEYTLVTSLTDGLHTWYVLPVNAVGNGSWSVPMQFTVGGMVTDPDPPTVIHPSGEIVTDTLVWPLAQWTHVEGAQVYITFLSGPGINIPAKGYVYPSMTGDDVDGVIDFQIDSMGWPIQYDVEYYLSIAALSDYMDYGDPNDAYDFAVNTGTSFWFSKASQPLQLPGQGGLIAPINVTTSNPVAFEWQADPNAQQYWLWIQNDAGREWDGWISSADAGCVSGLSSCTYGLPVDLPAGSHSWYVLPANALGNGSWSVPAGFNIGGMITNPDPPTVIHPAGEIVTDTLAWPVAQWTHVEGAAVYITFLSGPGIDIPVKGYVYPSMTGDDADGVIDFQIGSAGYPIQYGVEYHLSIAALSDYADYGDLNDGYDFAVNTGTDFSFSQP